MIKAVASAGTIAFAGFCVFGFLASFEPGVSLGWKLGYAVAFGASLFCAAVPWIPPRS